MKLQEIIRNNYKLQFFYNSLVPFCIQIPCLHENLNAEGYEGSAIL